MTNHHGFRIERNGAVATVTLDNGRVNTVDPELIESLIAGLPEVLDDPVVRCVVIRGKEKVFVGGADLRVMRRLDPATYTAMRRWVAVQNLLVGAPKPVLAALNGHALGGGAELALACDRRVLHAEATFGFPEVGLGIFPGAGGTQRLPRLVGRHRALSLMMMSARLSAVDALAEGLVDVIAGDDFEDVVAHEAALLAELPTATVGLLKRAVHEGMELPFAEGIDLEESLVMANLQLADAAEGLQAFLNKRAPEFKGR